MWSSRERARKPRRLGSACLSAGALVLGWTLHASPTRAIELDHGPLVGSFDTTISHGVTFRVGKRDAELAAGANDNDGNLNYDRGLVSNVSRFTSDLDLDWGDFGAFARFTGFFDFENENGSRERTPLSSAAKDRVGKNIEVLDLYLTGAFEIDDEGTLDLRLGKHVLNWGESTFIQNGINSFSTFDVSKLRLPGSELREAAVPVWMVSASAAPTDALSVEGFYQIDWEKTEIDPVGSYFSTVDYVGAGANRAMISIPGLNLGDMGLSAGRNPFAIFTGVPGFEVVTAQDPKFLRAQRGADQNPKDSGQWGIALRYLVEELNNTEFGFHFVNYHSRLPTVGAHTGTAAGAGAGLMTAGTIQASGPTGVQTVVDRALDRAGCTSASASAQCGAVAAAAQQGATEAVQGAVQAAGIDAYAKTGHYFIKYPKNIQLLGVSFNTEIGNSGWALQGEYSFHRDAPLQFAEEVVFDRALAPFVECLREGAMGPALGPACVGRNAAAGRYDADIAGFVRRDVSQVQATATKLLGPTLGADGMAFITEVALMRVHDMPDMDLESPAAGSDADATSWGYRMAARLDYNNAVGAVNLFPYAQFRHDVGGDSPSPGGSFVSGLTALTLGLRADYLARWEAGIGYTRYAGSRNELRDRDFVSASVKYSF